MTRPTPYRDTWTPVPGQSEREFRVKAPVETVTPIKPSEAIRLGCLLSPHAIGSWMDEAGATCALGAMQLGFGGEAGGFPWPEGYQAFRDGPPLRLPRSGRYYGPGAVVMILNDLDKWSRERIADWLEGLGL